MPTVALVTGSATGVEDTAAEAPVAVVPSYSTNMPVGAAVPVVWLTEALMLNDEPATGVETELEALVVVRFRMTTLRAVAVEDELKLLSPA